MSNNRFDPSTWAEMLIEFGTQEGNGTLFKKWINQSPCNWMTLEEAQNSLNFKHHYNDDDIRYSSVSQIFLDLIDKLSKDGSNDLLRKIINFSYVLKDSNMLQTEDLDRQDCKIFGALYSAINSIEQTNKTKFEGQISKLTEQSKMFCNELDATQLVINKTHHPCTEDII